MRRATQTTADRVLQWTGICKRIAVLRRLGFGRVLSVHHQRLKKLRNHSDELFEIDQIPAHNLVYPLVIDIEIFVHKDVSNSSHRTQSFGEALRNDLVSGDDLNRMLFFIGNLKPAISNNMAANIKHRLDRNLDVSLRSCLNKFVLKKLFSGICAADRFESGNALPYPTDAFQDNVTVNHGFAPNELAS